jgi:uncharacterized protein (DUF1015 family)
LQPIHAVRYATDDGDLTPRVAPPYDVLDEQPKQELLARDPHNIVAIDLPVTPPKTLGPDQAYQQAGQTFRQWLDAGLLQRDPTPAVFAYEQQFEVNGQTLRRRGLFTNLATEPFGRENGGIHRHELTIKGGTDDRLKLMQATDAQLSPVFGMFADPAGRVVDWLWANINDRAPDLHALTEHDGVIHRCWHVAEKATIEQLQQFFRETDVFIADGHHRYTTALNYAEEHADRDAARRCLFVLVAMEDPGMIVLPTHRVVTGLRGFDTDKLVASLTHDGLMTMLPTAHGPEGLDELAESLPTAGPHAMGLFGPDTRQTWILATNSDDPLGRLMPDRPKVWRTLDVAVLHELLIERVLKPRFGTERIGFKYTADLAEMRRMAEAEPGRLGVIMQPTPQHAVCDVARAGEVMPPKSTFFFPKLATGLVINPLT